MTLIRLALIAAISMMLSFSAFSQSYNIGIRAGLNKSSITGPKDASFNEKRGLSGGFHFGVNFQWNFNDIIGLRSEILYTQAGGTYEMSSPEGFYIFDLPDAPNFVLRDTSKLKLEMSNAYIQFPQTLHLKINDKFEIFAGGYIGLLINPVATGTLTFGGEGFSQDHSFRQGLNFNYYSDDDPFSGFGARPSLILIRVLQQNVDIPNIVDSFDFLKNNNSQSRFVSIDYGLIAGASYFLNRGLYIMGRVEYGGKDITRNSADYSFTKVNDDGTLIYPGENNKHLGYSLSIGFRF